MKWYIKCIRQYADFKGRARREEYWMFTLFNFLITMVLLIPFFLVVIPTVLDGGYSDNSEGYTFILALAPVILYGLFILLPNLAVSVRRFHVFCALCCRSDSLYWFYSEYLQLSCMLHRQPVRREQVGSKS